MSYWTCRGCGTTYEDGDASTIIDHVQNCDLVDGAGNPIEEEEEEGKYVHVVVGMANLEGLFVFAYASMQAQTRGLVEMARIRWKDNPDAEEYEGSRAFRDSDDRESALEFIGWDEPDLLLIVQRAVIEK